MSKEVDAAREAAREATLALLVETETIEQYAAGMAELGDRSLEFQLGKKMEPIKVISFGAFHLMTIAYSHARIKLGEAPWLNIRGQMIRFIEDINQQSRGD